MIGSDVVGDVIQQQPRPPGGQLAASRGQCFGAAEGRVDDVLAHTVRRPDDVLVPQVRQRLTEGCLHVRSSLGQGQARRASFPHAHQPHRVDPGRGDRVPIGGAHVG
jgi:hypothetical protein